jgi:hypothetical protein
VRIKSPLPWPFGYASVVGEVGIEPDLHEATGLQPATTPCDLSPVMVSERLYGPLSMFLSLPV